MRKSKTSNRDEQKCGISGCDEDALRSLPTKKVTEAVPEIKISTDARRVHLCKKHYKVYKKATKQQRKLDTLNW